MKKNVLFKNMRQMLPLCMIFLVAGFTSCNSDLNTGTEVPWEMTSGEGQDSTEYNERVNLVAKEELPDWLITILDSMDEHDALYCGVFTAQWNGKKIYHILNLLRSSFFADVYNADGSPLIGENDYDLYKAEWCLIYIVNQDETMYETMISIFLKALSFKTQ